MMTEAARLADGDVLTTSVSDWTDIGSIAELESSSRLEADVDGYRVRVARVNGTLYAFEDRCTHDDSPFDDAPIENTEIICPRHGARFCLADRRGALSARLRTLTDFRSA